MRNWQKHGVILIAYTLVALGMSYPLILNFTTAIPGLEGDAPSFVWALGWMKTAVERGINPFHSDFVFYPLGGATQLLWTVSLVALVSIPFQYLLGLIATHNLFYLAATVLTAYGMYLLAEYTIQKDEGGRRKDEKLHPSSFILHPSLRHSSLAPFVAGLVFAFAPLRLGYGLAFFNLFNTQLIPFYALFLLRAVREQSRRHAVVAGVLLGLNVYIDFQIAAFLVLFTALYAAFVVATLVASSTTKVVTTKSFALIALVSLLVAAPMFTVVANDFATEGGNYIRVFPIKYSTDRAYDLVAYFVPNAWSSLYHSVPLKIAGVNAPAHFDDVNALSPDRQSFIGYIVLVLAACATATQWRRARFWSLTALVFALLSLGPSLHVLGRDIGVPMPYLILHEIPLVNHIRIPMRYGIMVSFALAMLAAIAIQKLKAKSQKSPLVALAACCLLPAAILLEYAILPYPIQPLPIPRIYHDIARVPGDFTVLEIPSFNWRYAAATEVYQAIHGKRILRAYTNRIAPDLAEYAGSRGTPIVVRSLRMLEGAEQGILTADEIAEDQRVRDEVVRFFDLRYAMVHRQYLKPAEARAIDIYLRDVLNARIVAEEGDAMAYEIPRAGQIAGTIKIDLRENISQMYAGRGWQFEYPPANFDGRFNFVFARGARSEIYFVADARSLRGAAATQQSPERCGDTCTCVRCECCFAPLAMTNRSLTINAYADPPQRVVVLLNGERAGEIELKGEWQDHRVTLSARALRGGMNRIELQYGAALAETIGVTTITIDRGQ